MKKQVTILAFIAFLLLACKSKAQDYFVVDEKDTTFCTGLRYATTAQGYLKYLEYTDRNGEKTIIKGKKKVPNVTTLFREKDSIPKDKVPQKAHRPESYIRYTDRIVDGKLKVYLERQQYSTAVYYNPSTGNFSSGGAVGTPRFFLKMPDGTYYKINKNRNMKKYIRPYLMECEEFRRQYRGDFSTGKKPFMEMIRLYNRLCD